MSFNIGDKVIVRGGYRGKIVDTYGMTDYGVELESDPMNNPVKYPHTLIVGEFGLQLENSEQNETEKLNTYLIEYSETYKDYYTYEAENKEEALKEFEKDLEEGLIRTEKMECSGTEIMINGNKQMDYKKLFELLSEYWEISKGEKIQTYLDIPDKNALAVRMMQDNILKAIELLKSVLVYEFQGGGNYDV